MFPPRRKKKRAEAPALGLFHPNASQAVSTLFPLRLLERRKHGPELCRVSRCSSNPYFEEGVLPLELLLPVPLDGVEGDVELEPLVLLLPEPVAPEEELVEVLELLLPVVPEEELPVLLLPVPMLPEDEPLELLFPVPVPPEGEVLEGLVEELDGLVEELEGLVEVLLLPLFTSVLEVVLLLVLLLASPL